MPSPTGDPVTVGRFAFSTKLAMTGIPAATGGHRNSACTGLLISNGCVITAGAVSATRTAYGWSGPSEAGTPTLINNFTVADDSQLTGSRTRYLAGSSPVQSIGFEPARYLRSGRARIAPRFHRRTH